MGRKEITQKLTRAAIGYFVKKKYSVHTEIGIEKWGKQRADLLAINLRGEIIITEVKSSKSDYTSDNKWYNYLDKCNKFYFCITEELYKSKFGSIIVNDAKTHGCGIAVLMEDTGLIRIKVSAKYTEIKTEHLIRLSLKMVWRYGLNAGNTRRIRQYIK